MIILINGAGSTGKTGLSQKILERFFFTYYSIDHIKMGLCRGDPHCDFSFTDNDGFIAEKMAPIIEGIIRTALENRQNLTVEGCYFESESIKRITKDYPNQIIKISLVMSEKYCANHFGENIQEFRNVIEKRIYEEERTLEEFIEENRKVSLFSRENGFEIFEIKEDYDSVMDEIINFIGKILM